MLFEIPPFCWAKIRIRLFENITISAFMLKYSPKDSEKGKKISISIFQDTK